MRLLKYALLFVLLAGFTTIGYAAEIKDGKDCPKGQFYDKIKGACVDEHAVTNGSSGTMVAPE